MARTGSVYRLYSDETDRCYIGSTMSKYVSIRLAHHRQNWRRGDDYQGIFNKDGKCNIETLGTMCFDDPQLLRKAERQMLENYLDTAINKRTPYLSKEEAQANLKENINKYHNSPKGKVAVKIATANFNIKRLEAINADESQPTETIKLNSWKERLAELRIEQEIIKDKDKEEKDDAPKYEKIDAKVVVSFD